MLHNILRVIVKNMFGILFFFFTINKERRLFNRNYFCDIFLYIEKIMVISCVK